jgi:hypothetical protein
LKDGYCRNILTVNGWVSVTQLISQERIESLTTGYDVEKASTSTALRINTYLISQERIESNNTSKLVSKADQGIFHALISQERIER